MSHNCIENIYNYLVISDKIATSGQPDREDITTIKRAGYQLVINLAMSDSPDALPDEKQIVEAAGMEYIHIPVVWDNPLIEDAKDFFKMMELNVNKKVFVHCVANKRVSVFIYLYRLIYDALNQEEAKKYLYAIWTPNQIWQRFIEDVMDAYR
ncbi:MAG: protein tyrosine phosphatase family protein [Calothrix sp. MO_167.B12]|nr:protein tyrosine phosphatase family protein [Calothrix sp. MO_167.B12]